MTSCFVHCGAKVSHDPYNSVAEHSLMALGWTAEDGYPYVCLAGSKFFRSTGAG